MASSSSSLNPKPQQPQPQPQQPPPPPTTSSPSPSPQLHPLLPSSKLPSSHPSHHPRLPDPSHSQGPIYPLAPSGRGYVPKTFRPHLQPTDQLVGGAGNGAGGGYPPRHAMQFPNQARNFGAQPNSGMRPPPPGSQQQYVPRFMAGGGGGPVKGRGAAKASPYQSPATGNGYRDSRDTNRDDTITVCNRKVRLSDGGSLYALCRSWVRNGLPKETQPQVGEGVKLLPRPLPTDVANAHVPDKSGSDDEDDEKEEDGRAVKDLSARELLQIHVNRAKKVRSRLRKDRLQRIERYKQRLALLLPSPAEQFRNDTAP